MQTVEVNNEYEFAYICVTSDDKKRKMKQLILILIIFVSTGCMTNYPLTTFYVKNTSDSTINFKASIIKYSSMGPFEMSLPFIVLPHDSIITRQVSLRKDAEPIAWFTKFIITPIDSIKMNDPNKVENWIKTTNTKGQPIYTFNLTK